MTVRSPRLLSIIGALFGVLLFATSGFAQSQKPVPTLTGRVVDLANMIAADWEPKLTAQLRAHEEKTGNQVVVLTIPSLNGEALEDYSLRVARTWALGQKDKNNGVLLLISKADRKIRIDTGYGVEGTLTDAISSFIINATIKPLFRKGLFNGGIVAGAGQIIEVLEADEAAYAQWKKRSKRKKGDPEFSWSVLLMVALWAMIAFGSVFTSILVRRFGREIKPGHYRWLGMDAGPNAPKPKRTHSRHGGGFGGGGGGGWSSGGGGFSGGGGSFGGGGSSGGW
ncbi:MAG: TPM domain-containing protein [Rhizobiaceae bacterium]